MDNFFTWWGKYWLLKTDSLHGEVLGNSKMIVKTNINGTVRAKVRLTRTMVVVQRKSEHYDQ